MKRTTLLLLVAAMFLASCGTPAPAAGGEDATVAPVDMTDDAGQVPAPVIKLDNTILDVDGTHPNDLGMYFVANAIYPVLKDALTKAGYIK